MTNPVEVTIAEIDSLNKEASEIQTTNTQQAKLLAEKALVSSEANTYLQGEAEALRTLGWCNILLGDYHTALLQSENALALFKKLENKQGESRALKNIGTVYNYTGEQNKALEYYRQAQKIDEETGDKKGEAASLINLGNICADTGDYSKALQYYLQSLHIREDIDDRPGQSSSLLSVGNVYNETVEYGRALEYYLKALNIKGEIGDNHGIGNCLNNIGNVYLKTEEYDTALEYYLRALQLYKDIGAKLGEGIALNNVSNIYGRNGEIDKSLEYAFKAAALFEEIGDIDNLATSFKRMGIGYSEKGEYSRAMEYYRKSLKIYESSGNKWGEAHALLSIGDLYKQKEYAENDTDQAVRYINKSLGLAEEMGVKDIISDAHKVLAELYEKTEDWKNFAIHFKKYHETEKETHSEETLRKIINLESQYEIEHARKQAEIERLKNVELAMAFKNLKDAEMQLVQSEKMASLGQLTAGIAHEINNPVNFLSGNVPPLRRDINDILKLIDMYENTLEDRSDSSCFKNIEAFKNEIDYSVLKDEIQTLLNGIETGAKRTAEIVKGLRNFSRLDENEKKPADIHEGIDSTLVLLNSQINDMNISVFKNYGDIPQIECYPGQLNQVFMNVLSNAVQALSQGGEIHISTELLKEKAGIRIRDNGSGMSEEVQQKIFEPFFTTKAIGEGTGLGLSIAYSIIKKHDGEISVESEPGKGTEFIIELPVKN